jgi:hypothetical protein
MSESAYQDFLGKCDILAELWFHYREDEEFKDFIEYNDIGLPLAYFIVSEVAKPTGLAEQYIGETYNLLAESLGLSDTTPYQNLSQMLDDSETED